MADPVYAQAIATDVVIRLVESDGHHTDLCRVARDGYYAEFEFTLMQLKQFIAALQGVAGEMEVREVHRS